MNRHTLTTYIIAITTTVVSVSCSQNVSDRLCGTSGLSQITINLPATRTELGNKSGDNYPTYWSEEDIIVANGTASTSSAIGPDRTSATFYFEDNQIVAPYNITYPYTEGSLCSESRPTIVFDNEQSFTAGSFGVGDAPMCGYYNGSEQVTLKHLAGVARLAIKGSVTLSKIEIIANKGTALAGEFDVDCQTGTISAVEARCTNKISYSTNQTLSSSTAKHFYITTPTGDLGDCEILVISDTGLVMKLLWHANDVKPGIVREFKEITFKGGESFTLEGMQSENGDLVIDTPDGPVVVEKYEDPDSLALASAKRTKLDIRNAKGVVISGKIFDAAQNISVITLSPEDYALRIILPAEVTKVSDTATSLNADYAINGSYWNVSTGKPTTMIKIDGEVLSKTNSSLSPRVNGLLFIYDNRIEIDESYAYPYFEGVIEGCDNVLSCGPTLMDDGIKISYDDFLSQTDESLQSMISFFTTRHPRTVIGRDDKGVIYFMVVDGRSTGNAEGMSIAELTKVCSWLGMTEALNLDGGGSSTLWSYNYGVINYPCDNKLFDHAGERAVLSTIVAIQK